MGYWIIDYMLIVAGSIVAVSGCSWRPNCPHPALGQVIYENCLVDEHSRVNKNPVLAVTLPATTTRVLPCHPRAADAYRIPGQTALENGYTFDYFWQVNGHRIPASHDRENARHRDVWYTGHDGRLTIRNVQPRHAGLYECMLRVTDAQLALRNALRYKERTYTFLHGPKFNVTVGSADLRSSPTYAVVSDTSSASMGPLASKLISLGMIFGALMM